MGSKKASQVAVSIPKLNADWDFGTCKAGDIAPLLLNAGKAINVNLRVKSPKGGGVARVRHKDTGVEIGQYQLPADEDFTIIGIPVQNNHVLSFQAPTTLVGPWTWIWWPQ